MDQASGLNRDVSALAGVVLLQDRMSVALGSGHGAVSRGADMNAPGTKKSPVVGDRAWKSMTPPDGPGRKASWLTEERVL